MLISFVIVVLISKTGQRVGGCLRINSRTQAQFNEGGKPQICAKYRPPSKGRAPS